MTKKQRLAIDFGTTNSLIAAWDEKTQAARLLSVPKLSQDTPGQPPLIPSLLYVEDGQKQRIVLGQEVKTRRLNRQRNNRLFRNFKRGMLTSAGKEPRFVDGAPWTDFDAGMHFLKGLLLAQPYQAGEIEQLVLTVPVSAFDDYLTWLNEKAENLMIENIQLVDESTAAALGYYITEPGTLVLVFDFGGGSLDLSLVKLPDSRVKIGGLIKHLHGSSASHHMARVIAKAGLKLGGSDIDHWLAMETLRRAGVDFDSLGDDYAPLLTACESAKIDLSQQPQAAIAFSVGAQEYAIDLQRTDLEKLMESNGFYEALRRTVDKIMHIAQRQGIFKEDLRHVLLTGGTSLIPSVQQALRSYFSPEVVKVEKPFSAVVEGALQIAAGMGLQDQLVYSYGLRYLDAESNTHRYDEIIPAGSPYPTPKPIELTLGASQPHQAAIEFVIGQVEIDAVSNIEVRYENGQAVFVAQAISDGQKIIPVNARHALRVELDPPGKPGVPRLQAQFSVNAQRQMSVTVVDLQTRKTLLKNAVLASLGEGVLDFENSFRQQTGCEPALAAAPRAAEQRLSPRRLGTLLNLLPPESISLDAAVEALKSDGFYVRYQAAELLSKRGDRQVRLIFEEFLRTGSGPQRAAIAHHLHRLSWFAAEPLLKTALADPDLRVRESAIYALCRLGTPQAYQMLLQALPNDDDALKSSASWGLGRVPDVAALPVLEIVLQSQDPEVRILALEQIASAESPAGLPAVKASLEDPNLEVRYAAALSWLELAGAGCLPDLANLIEASQGEVRRAYIQALFHATNYLMIRIAQTPHAGRIIQVLQTALAAADPETRLAAFMPLVWMDDARATQIFRQAFASEPDPDARAQMLYIAFSLQPAIGKALIQECLDDPQPAMRQTARQLLERQEKYKL